MAGRGAEEGRRKPPGSERANAPHPRPEARPRGQKSRGGAPEGVAPPLWARPPKPERLRRKPQVRHSALHPLALFKRGTSKPPAHFCARGANFPMPFPRPFPHPEISSWPRRANTAAKQSVKHRVKQRAKRQRRSRPIAIRFTFRSRASSWLPSIGGSGPPAGCALAGVNALAPRPASFAPIPRRRAKCRRTKRQEPWPSCTKN
jgi:hypothetical protein